MTSPTQSIADKIAAAKAAAKAAAQRPSAASQLQAEVAAKRAEEQAPQVSGDGEHIFYGELPPAVSYMTPRAKAVFFCQGYHVTNDPEVIDFCRALEGVEEVTGRISLADVPQPSARSRQRSWASAERTSITPGELLARAVRVQSTADLGGNSAASNSTV
jgi:hypothetical protein